MRRRSAIGLLLLSLGGVAACGRTELASACANGFSPDGGTDGCCPDGYQYGAATNTCVCHASSCCPAPYLWNAAQQACSCEGQACCPSGSTFDAVAQGCRCTSSGCCPEGFAYDADAGVQACVCQSDSCCPANYLFDSIRNVCFLADDAGCPNSYSYNPAVRACVCTGSACCPSGFIQAPAGNRCICDPSNPNACPANNACNPTSGACQCLNDLGCPTGDYCNSAGSCQSASSCTTNLDCPQGTYCNITSNVCIQPTVASCAVDAECSFGLVCQGGACVSGCYTTSDCPIQGNNAQPEAACVGANLAVSPPVLGSCQPYCLINDSCPVNSYCDAASGSCSPNADNLNCQSCDQCGGLSNYSCLQFIISGELGLFCGSTCASDSDCPGGFTCSPVILSCQGPGDESCPAPGQCTLLTPVNESPSYYCTGPNGQPYQYFSACAPLSGTCPAEPYP